MIDKNNLESYINDEAKIAMTFRILAEKSNSKNEKMCLNNYADDCSRRVNTLCTLYYGMMRRHYIPVITPQNMEKNETYVIISDCIRHVTNKINVYGLEARRQSSSEIKEFFDQASRDMNACAHGLEHILLMRLHEGVQNVNVKPIDGRHITKCAVHGSSMFGGQEALLLV